MMWLFYISILLKKIIFFVKKLTVFSNLPKLTTLRAQEHLFHRRHLSLPRLPRFARHLMVRWIYILSFISLMFMLKTSLFFLFIYKFITIWTSPVTGEIIRPFFFKYFKYCYAFWFYGGQSPTFYDSLASKWKIYEQYIP